MNHAHIEPPGDMDLQLAGLTLAQGRHFQRTSSGLTILTSGHRRIRLFLEESADMGEVTQRVISEVLGNSEFSEETFDNRSRPASIFRSLSRRFIGLVTEDYKMSLSRVLYEDDFKRARRAAKLLNGIYQTAAAYPSLSIMLHCYFRTESISPQKIIGYVRERLIATGSQTELELLHFTLLRELARFGDEFEVVVRKTAQDELKFHEAVQLLVKKVERLGGRHGVSVKNGRKMQAPEEKARLAG
jgi:hypothetical protein